MELLTCAFGAGGSYTAYLGTGLGECHEYLTTRGTDVVTTMSTMADASNNYSSTRHTIGTHWQRNLH
jgi:hypothetical protein